MALDESVDKLEKLESNSITAYIAPDLLQTLKQFGEINVDYLPQRGGYTIRAGASGACKGCSGC